MSELITNKSDTRIDIPRPVHTIALPFIPRRLLRRSSTIAVFSNTLTLPALSSLDKMASCRSRDHSKDARRPVDASGPLRQTVVAHQGLQLPPLRSRAGWDQHLRVAYTRGA